MAGLGAGYARSTGALPPMPALAGSGSAAITNPVRRNVQRIGTRMYKSAGNNRLTQGLPSVPMSADQVSHRTLRVLRARSRYEVANSDIARRAVSLYDVNVIGRGIALQAQVTYNSGDPDEDVNRVIEDAWREWGRKGNCDVTGELSWWDIQRLWNISKIVDGEYLLRRHVGWGGKFPYALQIIDPELLEIEDNRQLSNGNWVRMGIEFNDLGRPVAYWIVKPEPRQGLLSYGYAGRRAERIMANEVLYGFQRERVGQSRGTPRLANCLLRLAHLEGAEDAALVALRLGASKLGFFKDTGQGNGFTGDDLEAGGSDDPEAPSDRIVEADIGSFGELPYGVELETWDTGYPNNEYAPFQKRLLQNLGSGSDLSYPVLGNDYEGVTFSSARIARLDAQDIWEVWQEDAVQSLCTPVFEEWLYWTLMSGKLHYPGNAKKPLEWQHFDRFRQVRHQPRNWEGVDRLKETAADVLAVEACQTSLTDVCRRRHGRDVYDIIREREREIAAMTKAGIPQSPKLNEQILAMAAASDEEGKGNAQGDS